MKITVIRMNASLRKAIPLLLLFVLLCFQSHAQQASVTLDRVASFMQAYNAHDIDAILLNMSDDVKWFNVADNQLIAETTDKKQLYEAMQAHFKAKPNARSRIKDSIALGDTLGVIEEAFSDKNGITTSQCAMSIYQLSQGLIISITYYAAAKC